VCASFSALRDEKVQWFMSRLRAPLHSSVAICSEESTLDEFLHEPQIAYFSLEIVLRDDIPTCPLGIAESDAGLSTEAAHRAQLVMRDLMSSP
jgi:hypothetical protein